jgi:hypothetical protein
VNYWDANKSEFPGMAAAARDYLAIPASEVDIERLFSIGRDILGVRRWSMNADTMGILIILRDQLI